MLKKALPLALGLMTIITISLRGAEKGAAGLEGEALIEKINATAAIEDFMGKHRAFKPLQADMQSWAERDPAKAVEMSQKVVEDLRSEVYIAIGRGWAKSDPQKAAEWAQTLSDKHGSADVMSAVAVEWAKTDPVKAVVYARKNSGGSAYMEGVLAEVAVEWAKTDLAKAIALVETMTWPNARRKARRGIAAEWAKTEPAKAAKWALKIVERPHRFNNSTTHDDGRDSAIGNVAIGWAKTAPEKALDLLPNIKDQYVHSSTTVKVFSVWAQNNPSEAFEKAQSIADEDTRKEVLTRVCVTWGKVDYTKAVAFAGKIEDKKLSSSILGTIMWNLRGLAEHSPAEAAEKILLVNLPAKKMHELWYTTRDWAKKDPDKATEWAKSVKDNRKRLLALMGVAKTLVKTDKAKGLEVWTLAVDLTDLIDDREERLYISSRLLSMMKRVNKAKAKELMKKIEQWNKTEE